MVKKFIPDKANELLNRAGGLDLLARRASVPENAERMRQEAQGLREQANNLIEEQQARKSAMPTRPTQTRVIYKQRTANPRRATVAQRIKQRETGLKRLVNALYARAYSNPTKNSLSRRVTISEEDLRGISNVNEREIVARHEQLRRKALEESYDENRRLSTNTRLMLERLRQIQTKGARDNDRMQRVLRERRIIAQAGDLMKTPNLFKRDERNLNILQEDPNHDILLAPNTFKANPDNNILRPRGFNILQTNLTGNNIMQRRPDSINILEPRPDLNIVRPQIQPLALRPFSQQANEAFRLRW